MRVLHVISGLRRENGGPPIVLAGLAAAQVRAGLEVSVVATWTTDPCPDVVADFEAHGVKVTHIGPATNPLSRHPETRVTLDRLVRGADVVHVHAIWEDIQYHACRAARAAGVPYVVTPHGMLDPWNMSNRRWRKRLYLWWRMRGNLDAAAAVHFATAAERDAVARMGLGPRAIVEPFGIDPVEFAELPAAGTFRARYPQLAACRLVVFLGRIDFGKGLELLIPAFAKAAQGAPDAALVIVGPDSYSGYRATVEAMITRHGVGGRTVFTGMLSGRDKLAALADAYVLAQPSFHENFGMFVPEALACGCPVIISDQVYLHPAVTGAEVGAVVQLEVEAVGRELAGWLNDPARRDLAAGRARGFALGHFSWAGIGARWVGHYQTIVGSSRR